MADCARVSVVLGAGPVGRALVGALHARGTRVRVVTRSGRAQVPAGVDTIAADISDADAARRACAGAGLIYGCVGLGYTHWPTQWPQMMAGMLAGAEAAGARFVFMDNLYMYGPAQQPLTEDLPLTGYGRKPATRARITRMWQDAHTSGRVRAVAVRASDFYGPGVRASAFGDLSFGRLARGLAAQVLGDVDQPHSVTYVPDIARALVTIGDADDDVTGQAWHVPNAADRTPREILQLFADALRLDRLRVSAVPRALLSVLGLFMGDLREMKEMLYQWERPFLVDHSKFAARFWSDPTPFEEGLPKTASSYRQ